MFVYGTDLRSGSRGRFGSAALRRTRRESCRRRHTVAPGESLWSISAGVLATEDPGRIARYWPMLYESNRSVIGPDPNLIRPGQILRLPRDCA